jgi:hypothetical protein
MHLAVWCVTNRCSIASLARLPALVAASTGIPRHDWTLAGIARELST